MTIVVFDHQPLARQDYLSTFPIALLDESPLLLPLFYRWTLTFPIDGGVLHLTTIQRGMMPRFGDLSEENVATLMNPYCGISRFRFPCLFEPIFQ